MMVTRRLKCGLIHNTIYSSNPTLPRDTVIFSVRLEATKLGSAVSRMKMSIGQVIRRMSFELIGTTQDQKIGSLILQEKTRGQLYRIRRRMGFHKGRSCHNGKEAQ
jgi:hypothetical protein